MSTCAHDLPTARTAEPRQPRRQTHPGFAGARRLNRGVEGQHLGQSGVGADQIDEAIERPDHGLDLRFTRFSFSSASRIRCSRKVLSNRRFTAVRASARSKTSTAFSAPPDWSRNAIISLNSLIDRIEVDEYGLGRRFRLGGDAANLAAHHTEQLVVLS
jgi:hypothetical protein